MGNNLKYTLGLDIGTTSIGWAVVNNDINRIEDWGVRIFEIPEDKSGVSLAEPRRAARSTRRRLARRRQRLNHLKQMFIEYGFLTPEKIDEIITTPHDPYKIRKRGICEKLATDELFIALYNIAKRRGYKSNRKSVEENDKKSDSSKVLSAISNNLKLLLQNDNSVAKTMIAKGKFRNSSNNYSNSFIRENFLTEAQNILDKQAEFYPEITSEFRNKILFNEYFADESGHEISRNFVKGLRRQSVGIFAQRPFMTSELIAKMRGKSELSNSSKPCAAKSTYTFEMFRLLQDIAHLGITINGEKYILSKEEITKIVDIAKNNSSIKYSKIREILGHKNDFTFRFDYVRGKLPDRKKFFGDDYIRENEKNEFGKMKFYHAIKKALKDFPDDWNYVEKNIAIFDEIGEILSTEYSDELIKRRLREIKLSDAAIMKILPIDFSGFGKLALDEYAKITPYFYEINEETGKLNTYNEAMELAGFDFQKKPTPQKKLRSLNENEQQQLKNPVVKRAISQSRKVINAIIDKYGSPWEIHLEATRELGKNFNERNKQKRSMEENQDKNEKIVTKLKEFGIASPTGLQITKYKLYEEQGQRSAYFGEKFDLNQLFSDERYAEIDHIIPFSRCGNDGLENKVLVSSRENQEKRNMTPYEAWGGNDEKWQKIEQNVARMGVKFYPFKKRDRILSQSKPNEDWNSRALNDTRYISKFLANYLQQNLEFATDEDYLRKNPDSKRQTVFVPTGFITATLRRFYGLNAKDRSDNLHHAIDATIIATTNQSQIQKFTRLNQYWDFFGRDIKKMSENEVQKIYKSNQFTGEVLDEMSKAEFLDLIESMLPWPKFREEINFRQNNTKFNDDEKHNFTTNDNFNIAIFRDQFRQIYSPDFAETVRPIFVSRMPRRKASGPAHAETIRATTKVRNKWNNKSGVFRAKRTPLNSIKLKDLGDSALKESDPKLLAILRKRLEKFDNDPAKAFAEPVYKPLKNGENGPEVKAIRVYSNQPSGFKINHGKGFVRNGTTVRLDIFKKNDKFYFAPIYLQDLRSIENGREIAKVLPIPTGRSTVEKSEFDKIREKDGSILAKAENGFEKIMNVFPNDYLQFKFIDKSGNIEIREGYYLGYGIKNGVIKVTHHLTAGRITNDEISAQSAREIKKLDISVLGDNYSWRRY